MKLNFVILVFTILCLSCNKNKEVSEVKNNDGTDKFICTKNNFSDFVVVGSSSDRYNKPYLVTYVFKGKIKNNTENIYEKAFIRGELILVLENGNELTCDDINYTKDFGGDGVNPEIRGNWKPKEEWDIEQLKSCGFPIEYFDYPIKEVFTQYYLQLTDQINNIETEILISQSDVTNKWKLAQKKVKNNSVDCEDKAFDLSKFLKTK
ncbi:MAG: hypothetical protein O9282_05255 [Flavobacterium sp.]|jgi:hypothetical protein|uniref:hypothetical protein n=1 Tax=Flavobacterium sp. TaxID=239 RepID=UPI0022C52861|nr:hypothetical protein [Flavobacterium sp.]MCZ8330701.1 hypothetical protein [Flavobacterium sp.]